MIGVIQFVIELTAGITLLMIGLAAYIHWVYK